MSSSPSYFPPQPSIKLPARVIADSYVERFFSDVNDVFWVISYKDFMYQYRHQYPNKSLDQVKQVILLMIFAFASKDASDNACDVYYTQALNCIGMAIESARGSLEIVQALILMVLPNSAVLMV